MSTLHRLWAYRGFIAGSVTREFQAKYRNSLLGAAWTLLNPLAMIIVYTVVFSQLMQAKLPGVEGGMAYSVYLCAGILCWTLFAEIAGRTQNVFIENANLIKKLQFPKLCLPVIVSTSALVNFSIFLLLFFGFLLLIGNWPGAALLALVPVVTTLVLFAAGLGVALGVLNVFFRDVGQFFAIGLQFWFWLTPIVYPIGILPDFATQWIALNPLTALVGAVQGVFVSGQWPDWAALAYPLGMTLMSCALALWLFKRHAEAMVDEL